MRIFRMYRRGDISLTHNADQVNPPDEVQFEGVLFSDGKVAIRWLTKRRSISVWESLEDMLAIHGHPEYQSDLIWDEPDHKSPIDYVTCSTCGKKVSNSTGVELVVRAYVQCPECIEKDSV